MKKVILILGGLFLVSCKKDVVCTCTTTSSGVNYLNPITTTQIITVSHTTKNAAIKGPCWSGSTAGSGVVTEYRSCAIK